jgi:copper chaperone CopZ
LAWYRAWISVSAIHGRATERSSRSSRDKCSGGVHLAGIRSAADALHVERLLRALPGVVDIVLSPITEIAYVVVDPARIDPERILRALDATGHGPASRWRP